MAFSPPPPPIGPPLAPLLPDPNPSAPPEEPQPPSPARSPAPAAHPPPRTSCAGSRAASQSPEASAPVPPGPTSLSDAQLPACCKTDCPAPTGPKTTVAVAQTTAKALPLDPFALSAAPAASCSLARSPLPTHSPSAPQTTLAAAIPPRAAPELATPAASPEANALPARKSPPPPQLAPLPTTLPISASAPTPPPQD